jgi:hypothetical protein
MYAFADGQRIFEEVEGLKTILSQLEEPINRSATQLKDLHDRRRVQYLLYRMAAASFYGMTVENDSDNISGD